jgi:predicted  nucleic acid-binding Zn-ribbon protein
MWQQFLNFIAAILSLARDLEEARKDIRRMNEQLHELALVVERLQGQIIAISQHEQAEREKLDLQIQLKQK